MRHPREDEVTVGLVNNEGDVLLPCERSERSEQAVRIYCTSLVRVSQYSSSMALAVVRGRTGLFGVQRTIAFVFGVINSAQRSGEGKKPSFGAVCNNTGLIPSIVRVILSPVCQLQSRPPQFLGQRTRG